MRRQPSAPTARPHRADTMGTAHPLFVELEAILTNDQGSQRFTILRKVTDLFLAQVDTYSDEHVQVFDQVMNLLVERIERRALVELSRRLAAVDRAPARVIGRLSQDDDIGVAGPVLEQSTVLTDRDLVEIAKSKSQAHLSSIAGRAWVAEPVTDVLIERGDIHVARKVTANAGARFSDAGFAKAVTRAEQDEPLALAIANRVELPASLLEQLVRKATARVRQRLLAGAGPHMRERIVQVLSTISHEVARSAAHAPAKSALPPIRKDPTELRERIAQCADAGDRDGIVEALAALAEVPAKTVRELIRQSSEEAMLVLGRACGLAWPQVQQLLSVTMPEKVATAEVSRAVCERYVNLRSVDAGRAVRFMRQSTFRSAAELLERI